MSSTSQVAEFLRECIDSGDQKQRDIAEKAGFDKPNMITMIKQGKTRLPLAKVGPVARAIERDPVELLQMCFEEYYPETWKAIEPYMQPKITEDERRLLVALRTSSGGPYLAALDETSRGHLESFIRSLRDRSAIQ